MSFRISGLGADQFSHLYGLSDEELLARNARRYRVDKSPGFPDRVELRDLEPGESALLVNYTHQSADTPYRASHAVFVREGAQSARTFVDEIPEVMLRRMLSLRGFDAGHMLIETVLVDGRKARDAIEVLLADPAVAYVQAHYAKAGCYAARVDRVARSSVISSNP